jgi:peptide deformylase
MKLPLAYYGDPVLRQKGARIEVVDDEVRQLVHDMIDTMNAHNGVGLAAPQVHRSIALFITAMPLKNPDDTWTKGVLRVFINPKIISHSEEMWGLEQGCLSIPGISEKVIRPLKVTIEATDLEGNVFTHEFNAHEAQAVMHENDHINGVLFIDRLTLRKRKGLEPILRAIKKKYDKK